MSILFNKHTIALLFFLFGFIHIEVFNQEKIPGLLLIVLGSYLHLSIHLTVNIY